MKKLYIFFALGILLINFVTADNQTISTCGGDGESMINCLGDNETTFFGSSSNPPSLAITRPENVTYTTGTNLELNFTVSNQDYVLYNLDSGANTTITGNTTFNTTSGLHTLYLFANNTGGTTAKNVTFTINLAGGGTPTPTSSGGGTSSVIYQCRENNDCSSDEVCLNNQCVKLFDIKIIDFDSPAKLGEFFEFTYFVKGMAEINGDVQIDFWMEKNNEIVTSGSDVIYFGSFEEKTEKTKIFLPENMESGIYQFFVQVNYGSYKVSSHRTVQIEVGEKGVVKIKTIDNLRFASIMVIVMIVILSIILSLIIYYATLRNKPSRKTTGKVNLRRIMRK